MQKPSNQQQVEQLKRTSSIFTSNPSGIVSSAWHGLTKPDPEVSARRKSLVNFVDTFASCQETTTPQAGQQRGLLRVNTRYYGNSPEQQSTRLPVDRSQRTIHKSSCFRISKPRTPGPAQRTPDSASQSKLVYWNEQLAERAEKLLASKALSASGVAKMLGDRIGPPRHSNIGTIDYSNLGLGQLNFPEIAGSAISRTPKNKLSRLHADEKEDSNFVRVVTAGVALDAPALSNLTPVQMAILQIEKVRAKTQGSLSGIRQSRHEARASSNNSRDSRQLHFTLRHKSHRKVPAGGARAKRTNISDTFPVVDALIREEVQYVSDSDSSAATGDLDSAQSMGGGMDPHHPVKKQGKEDLPQSPRSFKDDLVSVASSSTWVPRWTRTMLSPRSAAQNAAAEAKSRASRTKLLRLRAEARRQAVLQRHKSILEERRLRAELAATHQDRRRAARRLDQHKRRMATAVLTVAKSKLWWSIMSTARDELRMQRIQRSAGKKIARWIEHQMESKLVTKAARDRLIVTLFIKRYIWKTRDQKTRRLASVVQNFLNGVLLYGSRTRLLLQSKRYFAAVSVISSAWRRLRTIVSCEQRMLTLLWAKHEHNLLQPIYKELTRSQQRKNAEVHEIVHGMDEETLALYDTRLARGEMVKLAIPTPQCVVRRVTRMHLFYLRQEYRDCNSHHRKIVHKLQPFLQRKRRQLELAQRLAFHGRPSSFAFDESALEQFLPPSPDPFKAFMSKSAIQAMIEHTRADLDRRVANADSWYLRRQWQ